MFTCAAGGREDIDFQALKRTYTYVKLGLPKYVQEHHNQSRLVDHSIESTPITFLLNTVVSPLSARASGED